MALNRPPMHLSQEPVDRPEGTLEMNVEQQILGQLTLLNRQVTEIKHGQELMEVSLLGSIEGDTQHGRLPMVENTSKDHEHRLKSLENDRIRWKAYAAAAAFIGGVAGSALTLIIHSAIAIIDKH
jgi:hypothetical protein